jgi:hydroxymethylpyrimidine pyrophosphatase-like HAD family hydrolase
MIRPTMPLVIYNGAVTAVYDSAKGAVDIVASSILPEEIFREIVAKARTIPEVGTLVMEALGKRAIDKADTVSLAYFKKVGIVWEETDAALPYDKEDPPVKVLMYVKNGKAPDVADKLKTMLGDKVVVKQGNPFVIDITPAGQTKAAAISAIVKSLGYKMDRDVMAFGDSGNDKEMLAEAALGMAMANCKPETCESARMIIGPNSTDSIAKAIRALAILESCRKK